MGLIVKHADGSEFLNIANKSYDDVSTSLKLPGKGVLNWGEAYVNNFVHLLENFASSVEPINPQVGQLWYNTGSGVLSVYTIAQEWEIVNKDTDIEAKFDALVNELQESNAGTVPPSDVATGTTWFDTNINVLKVFNGVELMAQYTNVQNDNGTISDPYDMNEFTALVGATAYGLNVQLAYIWSDYAFDTDPDADFSADTIQAYLTYSF